MNGGKGRKRSWRSKARELTFYMFLWVSSPPCPPQGRQVSPPSIMQTIRRPSLDWRAQGTIHAYWEHTSRPAP